MDLTIIEYFNTSVIFFIIAIIKCVNTIVPQNLIITKKISTQDVQIASNSASNDNIKIISLEHSLTNKLQNFFHNDYCNLIEIKKIINNSILDIIKDKLKWKCIRAIKGRVNNWKTVDLRYNSDAHRDRHIFGGTISEQMKASQKNLSAVIYLDFSKFGYYTDSSITTPNQKNIEYNEINIPEGSILIFPSCLIHKAIPCSKFNSRRTIVLFDIENPDEENQIPHNIIICPKWTQNSFFHKIFSEEYLEKQYILKNLVNNNPYFWRYKEEKVINRTHWQITKYNEDQCSEKTKYNTSFYLNNKYPSHMKVYDKSNNFEYLKLFFGGLE